MAQTTIRTRVETRAAGTGGTRARVLLGDAGTSLQIDVTGGLVAAIAHSLWQARGGDPAANWFEAEGVLDQLLGAANAPVQSEVKPAARAAAPAPAAPLPPAPVPIAAGGTRRTTPRR